MSQNIRATPGYSPRHGSSWNVAGSGRRIMSASYTRAKPSIAEPSKPIPSANAPSSSAGATATDFSVPSTSVNQSRTNRMSRSSSVRSTNSSCLSTAITLDVPEYQTRRGGRACTSESAWSVFPRGYSVMLRHVDPSAQHVRDLARRLVRETCEAERSRYAGAAVTGRPPPGGGLTSSALEPAWRDLLAGYGAHREAVAGQISAVAEASIASGDRSLFVICIRLASTLSYVLPSAEASCHPDVRFWDSFAKHVIHEHHAEAAAAARTDAFV